MPYRSGPARLARRLGARIRALRTQAKITQEQVAWDCDLSKAHLSQIESGRGFPSLPTLFELAKRLGVEAMDLLPLDPSDERTQLLEAVRTHDVEALRRSLRTLGLLDLLVGKKEPVGRGGAARGTH